MGDPIVTEQWKDDVDLEHWRVVKPIWIKGKTDATALLVTDGDEYRAIYYDHKKGGLVSVLVDPSVIT